MKAEKADRVSDEVRDDARWDTRSCDLARKLMLWTGLEVRACSGEIAKKRLESREWSCAQTSKLVSMQAVEPFHPSNVLWAAYGVLEESASAHARLKCT